MIEILQPGLLTTIQDAGRRGYESYGVPRSGVFDPFLSDVANKLVGNPPGTPLIEFAMVGPNLLFHRKRRIAVSGFGIQYQSEGNNVESFRSVLIGEGAELRFVHMKGCYGYIAVAGGIQMNQILGSVSTYVAGGIGKRLTRGNALKVGEPFGPAYRLRSNYWDFPVEPVIHLVDAPHTSLFQDRERQRLCDHSYKISTQSNRMGIRLEGPVLAAPVIRRSVPALPGAVQVPRSGSPIVLGPEGPTTGGYAQMAMICRVSWTVLAARRPGEAIRFQWSAVEEARKMWAFRNQLLNTLDAWEPL